MSFVMVFSLKFAKDMLITLTEPVILPPSICGTTTGTTLGNFSLIAANVLGKEAFSLSTALIKMIAGILCAKQYSSAFSVPTVNVPDALVTITALSATDKADNISLSKSK